MSSSCETTRDLTSPIERNGDDTDNDDIELSQLTLTHLVTTTTVNNEDENKIGSDDNDNRSNINISNGYHEWHVMLTLNINIDNIQLNKR